MPERTALRDAPVPRLDLFVALVRTADHQVGEANALCQEHGVTLAQFNVLRILYDHDPGLGLPCSRIADRLVSRVPDITRLLDRLENAGWIERCRCQGDRRVVRTRLSPKGRGLVEALDRPMLELHGRLSAQLNDDEVQTLVALLRRLEPA